MKKVLPILALLVLAAPALLAQDAVTTRFGIKASPNLSWTRSDTKNLSSDGNRLGYSLGLMAEFPLGPTGNYRFATGLHYTGIGGSSTYGYGRDLAPDTAVVRRDMYKLRYLELPLTIKMMTNEIGYMRYYGQLGVSAGVNIRARQDFETITTRNGVVTTVQDTDIDIADDTKLFRAGLVIGGGMEYNFSGQTSLLVGITYNSSIGNFLDLDKLPGGLADPKLLADYLELTLGIFF
jgi:hypothetical protein